MVIGCRNSDSSCENQHILSSNDNSKVQPSSRQSPQPSTTATSSPINSLSPGQLPVPKSQNATVGSRGADGWFIDSSIPPLRDPVILREQVLLQLRRIIDPDLYKDIVSLGFVQDLKIDYDASSVSFTLELTTPACPVKDMFVEESERLLKELGWIESVDVKLTARKSGSMPGNPSANLSGVSHIVAVASCKGGVGKSSIACNVAYMLSSLGARVGLVDADIYGPSLPYLIGIESPRVYFSSKVDQQPRRSTPSVGYEGNSQDDVNKKITDGTSSIDSKDSMQKALATGEGGLVPLMYAGVKLMSYGYLKTSDFAAVRGPIASNVVYQMITQTLWGDLDFLIIDMPPGTGDIHLTIAQSVPITAAVMVTTPQQLSLVDVEKGILMFNKLKIPTIAVVENMSTFICPCCDTSHDIFSRVANSSSPQATLDSYRNVDRLMDQFGITIRSQLPIHPDLAMLRFAGPPRNPLEKSDKIYSSTMKPSINSEFHEVEVFPFVRAFGEEHPIWRTLKILCQDLIRELSAMRFSEDRAPDLRMLEDGLIEMIIKHPLAKDSINTSIGQETVLYAPSRDVRLQCRCAECVDEYTGRVRLNPRKIPSDLHIVSMKQSGNYAVSIDWSDNHHSLLAFATLEKIFKSIMENNRSAAASNCASTAIENQW